MTADELDVTAPSRLPGRTLGHVITHVTHSGEGHLRMLDAAARGEVGVQYAGGVESRNAGIEVGAPRPAVEHVDDLRRSCAALHERWATMPMWEGAGGTTRFQVLVVDPPFLRIRETAIHHVDLGIGFEFDDLPSRYVTEELRRMEMLWAARQPTGTATLQPAALAAEPSTRLGLADGPHRDRRPRPRQQLLSIASCRVRQTGQRTDRVGHSSSAASIARWPTATKRHTRPERIVACSTRR